MKSIDGSVITTSLAPPPTRRQFLKLVAAGGAVAATGGLATSCTSGSSGDAADVVITTSGGWPYGPMPTEEELEQNPNSHAYAETLQAWMDDNPGVTINAIEADIWNQEALITSLSGGTAPTWFMADIVAGFNDAGVKSAMAQGLMADVTDQIDTHDLTSQLEDFVLPIWDQWEIEGRYYAVPHSYSAGNGVHYRKDLVEELGLPKPHVGWTWEDVRKLAKGLTSDDRHGIALQMWQLQHILNAEGFSMMSRLPDPDASWRWRWDYTTMADQWLPAIERARGMIFEDKSVLADISMTDDDVRAAFVQGRSAMHASTSIFFTATPDDELSHVRLEEDLGRPLHEIVGWMHQPNGANGRTGATQGEIFQLGFSPDATEAELDAAVGLHLHMLGPGHIHGKTAIWERTNDPRHVYDWAEMTPLIKGVADQLPSSPEEAWGQEFMDTIREVQQFPLVPTESRFLPVEESTGPSDTAFGDMTSRWLYEAGNLDYLADMRQLEDTINTQARDFTSSISADEFVESARAYFDAHTEYWQNNAPDFFENVYRPWHERVIRPVLGG
jgi:ABC-type glycerol-3-phosphate transport system substrate-binding protein